MLHRLAHEARFGNVDRVEFPTGQHPRQVSDVRLRIAFLGLALRIEQRGTVDAEFVQADSEQLHHFARIVFVRHPAGRCIFLGVAAHIQVNAHRAGQGHSFEQFAISSKGALFEHVDIGRHRKASPSHRQAVHRNDKNL